MNDTTFMDKKIVGLQLKFISNLTSKDLVKIAMQNSKIGCSVKKISINGLNIDYIQYSNILWITYYSYLYSGTILNPNIIRIRIRPNICARILFVFVFAHSEKTNIIRIRIRSKFWFRILFVFVFGPKNSIRSPLPWTCLLDKYSNAGNHQNASFSRLLQGGLLFWNNFF